MEICRINRRNWAWALACAVFTGALSVSWAVPATNQIRYATDVSTRLRGVYYEDDQSISVGPYGAGALLDLSGFSWADRVGVDAVMVISNRIVFSTDVDFVQGTNGFKRQDLLAYDPATQTLSMYFNGTAAGLPANANLDAAAWISGSIFLFSLDVSASLPGVGWIADEDVIRWNGAAFQKLYDGVTDLGIPEEAGLDALYVATNNRVYFSLDRPARIGAASGSERDVWVYTPPAGPCTLAFSSDFISPGADLTALDEPIDTDGDWLTDFEEYSGVDEGCTIFPETTFPLNPSGNRSNPMLVDSDGDSYSDGHEAAAGSNPTNGLDYLHLSSVARSGTNTLLSWISAPGRFYDLYIPSGQTLTTNQWLWVAADYPSQGSITTWTSAPSWQIQFYRVRLSMQ
ncbi:MAG TPA: hypothetical protein DCZ95_10380 [Verrucomicrobia bacterium]|nr:MAG: hypothetical protein A2X46_18765 [Lentisphaerae bacterium GWF2_57_35]HBA84489.1 hypothetical protein [Verrucomicrobiota bacterium]